MLLQRRLAVASHNTNTNTHEKKQQKHFIKYT